MGWLGDWRVSWQHADGTTAKARNRISKTLDGKVIEENFEQDPADPPPLLRGRSISVLQQNSGIWQQAWADNQGGYCYDCTLIMAQALGSSHSQPNFACQTAWHSDCKTFCLFLQDRFAKAS